MKYQFVTTSSLVNATRGSDDKAELYSDSEGRGGGDGQKNDLQKKRNLE
jgi:hypothetical protein